MPVSQKIGVEISPTPARLSVNAATFWLGKKNGGDHHAAVNGTTVAFHHKMDVFRIGSYGSLAIRSRARTSSGLV